MVNIAVKNTFLVVGHSEIGESCTARKRCQSLPREWTPGAANISQWHFRYAIGMSVAAPSVSVSSQISFHSDPSPRSDSSFQSCYSARMAADEPAWDSDSSDPCTSRLEGSHADSCDQAEDQEDVGRCPSIEFTCPTPSLSGSNSGYLCLQEDVATVPSILVTSVTPTSSQSNLSSFCKGEDVATCPLVPFQGVKLVTTHSMAGHLRQEESAATGPPKQVTCASPSFNLPSYSMAMCPAWQQAEELQEPENEPESSMDACTPWTSLQSQALAFQPTPKDASMNAVVSCLHMALVSCGRLRDIKIERNQHGLSSTWLSGELLGGPCAPARSYEVMILVKQSLDAIVERLRTLSLLSSRIQREDWGYSLRCSIACLPSGAEGSMCWDMFRKGHCPRHEHCQWYHPQGSDISRLKVTIKNGEASNEQKLQSGSPDKKHKISLGELVH